MTLNLYELADVYKRLSDLAETDESLREFLDSAGDQLFQKVENTARALRSLQVEARVCRDEARRLQQRAQTREARADWLLSYIRSAMQTVGIRKVETALVTVSLVAGSKGIGPTIDMELLPEQFKRVVVTADRAALQALYRKTGEAAPGTEVVQGEDGIRITVARLAGEEPEE